MEMTTKEKMLKKVKENFKKKRRKWSIDYCVENNMSDAYDVALSTLTFLDNSFTEEEKEKWHFTNVKVAVNKHSDNKYQINVCM